MQTKKEKGDEGVTSVIADFTRNGFHVSLPIAEHLKYDLIIEKNGCLATVQSRYTSKKDGVVDIKLKSVWSNAKGTYAVNRRRGDFDILACYCPDSQKCYFIADGEFNTTNTLTLRIDASDKHQSSIRRAEDYLSCDRAFDAWLRTRQMFEEDIAKATELDVANVIEMKKDKTWQEIGMIYGVSGVTIRSYLQKRGVDVSSCRKIYKNRTDRSYDDEMLDMVLASLKRGESQRQIAKELSCSRYMVGCMVSHLKTWSVA